MADKSIVSNSKLDAIANAIKAKDSSATTPMTLDQMATAIANIPSGGDVDVAQIIGALAAGSYNETYMGALDIETNKIKNNFFEGCSNLRTVNIMTASLYDESLTVGGSAFINSGLVTLKMAPYLGKTIKRIFINGDNAFYACNGIIEMSAPICQFRSGSFAMCSNMTKFTSTFTSASEYCWFSRKDGSNNYTFNGCTALKTVDLYAAPEMSKANYVFYSCSSLKAFIIRDTNKIGVLSSNALKYSRIESGDAFIYVPDELVEDYKAATNWSVYANQIKPLSEYVEE